MCDTAIFELDYYFYQPRGRHSHRRKTATTIIIIAYYLEHLHANENNNNLRSIENVAIDEV